MLLIEVLYQEGRVPSITVLGHQTILSAGVAYAPMPSVLKPED